MSLLVHPEDGTLRFPRNTPADRDIKEVVFMVKVLS
jgi:hypothetical protein